MPKSSVYPASGFLLLNELRGGLRQYPAAAVNIVKGDALHDDTNGYATNATTDFASTFLGIANEDQNNSGGDVGDLNILVIPWYTQLQFIVPVGNDALITIGARGEIFDLHAKGSIDLADTTGDANAPGFFVDEIDVSAAAIAANTFGFAIGHFVGHTA